MARQRPTGPCSICGHVRELSFEHVPPRSAFNNRPVRVLEGMDIVIRGHDASGGRVHQKGAGASTLCDRCNNTTGSWYGQAYMDWACHGLAFVPLADRAPSLYLSYRIYPLRVIKQILCMFSSANGPEFRQAQPYVERFVMDRARQGLPRHIQIFCFFNPGPQSRQTGVMSKLQFDTGQIQILSEITFPPYGYVMCLGSPPPDERLVDITFFALSRIDDVRDLHLRLPVLPVSTGYAGDYRSAAEVRRQAQQSQGEARLPATPRWP